MWTMSSTKGFAELPCGTQQHGQWYSEFSELMFNIVEWESLQTAMSLSLQPNLPRHSWKPCGYTGYTMLFTAGTSAAKIRCISVVSEHHHREGTQQFPSRSLRPQPGVRVSRDLSRRFRMYRSNTFQVTAQTGQSYAVLFSQLSKGLMSICAMMCNEMPEGLCMV